MLSSTNDPLKASQSQERKRDDEGDHKDNSRQWKMSEKFEYWGKEFYNLDVQKLLKMHNIKHYSIP